MNMEPTMGNLARCGYNKNLTNMAFSPLVKSGAFMKWVYKIIKSISQKNISLNNNENNMVIPKM